MKNNIMTWFVAALLGLYVPAVFAVNATDLPEVKRTQLGLYLDSSEAYEMAQKEKLLFIDVRTRAEVNFLGMPTVADPNSDFVSEVQKRAAEKGIGKNDKIVVMCRSGDRSSKAVDLLAKVGYTKVYSVVDGYEGDMAKDGPNAGQRVVNGWRNSKLPWTYKLAKQKMYLEE